jgi:hypothetical protein
MRILGAPLPSKLARFLRFRLSELSEWPRQSFLFIGGFPYYRSWLLESPSRLMKLLGGGDVEVENFSQLRVWRPMRLAFSRKLEVSAILSSQPYGRFGNRIIQTGVGLAAAERSSAKYFLLRSKDFPLPQNSLRVGVSKLHLLVSEADGPFFAVPEGVKVHSGVVLEANWLLSQAVFTSRSDIVQGYTTLRSAPTIDLKPRPNFFSSPEELVLHFRGTDQIGHIWRPPPLAYFEKAVEHAGTSTVRIVTDDSEDPLVGELANRLRQRGIETFLQSGAIEDDMSTILSASTFCLGIGSFSSGLAALSTDLQVAYSWAQEDWNGWTKFYGKFDIRPDVQNFYVTDSTGSYVRIFQDNKNLTRSKIVDHMMSFSPDNLMVTDSSGIRSQ